MEIYGYQASYFSNWLYVSYTALRRASQANDHEAHSGTSVDAYAMSNAGFRGGWRRKDSRLGKMVRRTIISRFDGLEPPSPPPAASHRQHHHHTVSTTTSDDFASKFEILNTESGGHRSAKALKYPAITNCSSLRSSSELRSPRALALRLLLL